MQGDNEVMSTQEKGPVLGDQSSMYMNTEEAATRLAEDGINHNIDEALSGRMNVSHTMTQNTRAIAL